MSRSNHEDFSPSPDPQARTGRSQRARAERIRAEVRQALRDEHAWLTFKPCERAAFRQVVSDYVEGARLGVPILLAEINELLVQVSEDERLTFEAELLKRMTGLLSGAYAALGDMICQKHGTTPLDPITSL